MKRIGPGRPRLPEAKKASQAVCMRLTTKQARTLQKQARAMSLPISTYLRGLIFGFEEAE